MSWKGNTPCCVIHTKMGIITICLSLRTAFEKGKDYSVTRVGKPLLTQIKEDNFILGDTLSDELSNQVNEVAEQNVLLTEASRPTTSAGYMNYATSRNKQAAPASAQKCTFLLKNNKMGDVH